MKRTARHVRCKLSEKRYNDQGGWALSWRIMSWHTMPTGSAARRLAALREVGEHVEAARCAAQILRAGPLRSDRDQLLHKLDAALGEAHRVIERAIAASA